MAEAQVVTGMVDQGEGPGLLGPAIRRSSKEGVNGVKYLANRGAGPQELFGRLEPLVDERKQGSLLARWLPAHHQGVRDVPAVAFHVRKHVEDHELAFVHDAGSWTTPALGRSWPRGQVAHHDEGNARGHGGRLQEASVVVDFADAWLEEAAGSVVDRLGGANPAADGRDFIGILRLAH